MCCFSMVAVKSRLKLDKLSYQSEEHWQNHSTEAFFKVKDAEMVYFSGYFSQSDLGTFQLIFKDDNSTNNA